MDMDAETDAEEENHEEAKNSAEESLRWAEQSYQGPRCQQRHPVERSGCSIVGPEVQKASYVSSCHRFLRMEVYRRATAAGALGMSTRLKPTVDAQGYAGCCFEVVGSYLRHRIRARSPSMSVPQKYLQAVPESVKQLRCDVAAVV